MNVLHAVPQHPQRFCDQGKEGRIGAGGRCSSAFMLLDSRPLGIPVTMSAKRYTDVGPLKSFAVTHVLNVAGEIKPTYLEVLRFRHRVEAVVFVGTNHPAAGMHPPYRIHG